MDLCSWNEGMLITHVVMSLEGMNGVNHNGKHGCV